MQFKITHLKSFGTNSITEHERERVVERIESLYAICDDLIPVAYYINELEDLFLNNWQLDDFDFEDFQIKLVDLENTVKNFYNKEGVDTITASSGIFYNRFIFEVHNITKFEIRYFSCIELANPLIHKLLKIKNEFHLAKIFNGHRQVVSSAYF